MYRTIVVFCSLFLFSSAQSDLNDVIKTFINMIDSYVQTQNMSEIRLGRITKNFGIANIDIDGGYVKDLSSLELVDGSVKYKNDSDGQTVSFKIGFKTLQLHFGMVKVDSLLINIDDDVTVDVDDNNLDLKLKLKEDGDKCDISVKRAAADLGDFGVTIKDAADLESTLADDIIGYFVEKVMDLFANSVENFLNPQLQNTINEAVSKLDTSTFNLCKMLHS